MLSYLFGDSTIVQVHVGEHMCLFLLEIFLKMYFGDHKEGSCSILLDNIKDFLQSEWISLHFHHQYIACSVSISLISLVLFVFFLVTCQFLNEKKNIISGCFFLKRKRGGVSQHNVPTLSIPCQTNIFSEAVSLPIQVPPPILVAFLRLYRKSPSNKNSFAGGWCSSTHKESGGNTWYFLMSDTSFLKENL